MPVLFLFLTASVEFMRTSDLLHTADNAAYEAARRGIVPSATATDVMDTANSVLAAIGAQDAVITITPTTITPDTDEVTVEIDIPLDSNGLIAPMYVGGLSVSADMTMIRESFNQASTN